MQLIIEIPSAPYRALAKQQGWTVQQLTTQLHNDLIALLAHKHGECRALAAAAMTHYEPQIVAFTLLTRGEQR